jgi:hypothetical protein
VEIFAAQGAPPVWLKPEANGKNLQSENVFIIFLHLWEVELTYRCQQSDFVLIICYWYQQHQQYWWQNLPPVSLIPVANLPPVTP